MKRPHSGVLTASLILAAVVSAPCRADWVQSFSGIAADNGLGNPVNAKATFSFDSGTSDLTVVLENLVPDIKAVNQAISGLYFAFTTGQTSGTLDSSSGVERTVAADESYSDGGSTSTGWALLNNVSLPLSSGTGLHLDLLGTSTAPKHTIIGPPSVGDTYSNANSSIVDNGAHNPFLAETATYLLSISGLSDSSRVSAVDFQFNTSSGTNVVGVPEPSAFALVGLIGLGMLAVVKVRRLRRKVA